MHPAFIEIFFLSLIGVSGIAGALLFGIRHWIPVSIVSVAAAAVLRVWSSFLAWSLGRPDLVFELWIATVVAVIVGAIILRWREWRDATLAAVAFGGASVVALATKYLLDIGERHHSDSANVVGLAIIAIQGEMQNLGPLAGGFKRGIAYPLMLALGPEGRILSSFTPLVYLALLGAIAWFSWQVVGRFVGARTFLLVTGVIGVFSLSVPIFRAAMFYLNGHTLMALSMAILTGALLSARREQSFSSQTAGLVTIGGALGATARIEGIALVLVLVIAIVAQPWWSQGIDRLRLFLSLSIVGMTLSWWMIALDSGVLDRLQLSEWLLVAITLIGALVASSRLIDPVRRWLVPATGALLVALLARVVWQSSDPLATVLAQWPNLGLGRGGWGTAAHVFIGSIVLLGWKKRSAEYRQLLLLSVLVIATILFTKTFDGGFGREGFYDSVNRMWLHVMPMIAVTTIVGYAELVKEVLNRRSSEDEQTNPSRTVSAPMSN